MNERRYRSDIDALNRILSSLTNSCRGGQPAVSSRWMSSVGPTVRDSIVSAMSFSRIRPMKSLSSGAVLGKYLGGLAPHRLGGNNG